MEADYNIELGHDDPALELPWSDPDGLLQYCDLRQDLGAISRIDEARQYPEIGEFLLAINSPGSILESAKCDVWKDDELGEAEDIYEASTKLSCYVDLVFRETARRFELRTHQTFASRLVELVGRAPEVSAALEVMIRRCYYKLQADADESEAGFYFTCYVSGYGEDTEDARLRWSIGLRLVQNAIRQISAEFARDAD